MGGFVTIMIGMKGRLGEICDYNDWYEGRGGWGDL